MVDFVSHVLSQQHCASLLYIVACCLCALSTEMISFNKDHVAERLKLLLSGPLQKKIARACGNTVEVLKDVDPVSVIAFLFKSSCSAVGTGHRWPEGWWGFTENENQ